MTPCRMIVGYQLLHSDPSDSASVRMITIDWEDPNSLLLISVSGARITPHVAVASINSRKSHYVGIVAATSPRMHRGGARVDSGEIGMWAISTARSPRIRQVNCQREGFWQRERRNGLSTFGPSFRVNSCHVLLAKSTLHQFSLSHARIDPRSHLGDHAMRPFGRIHARQTRQPTRVLMIGSVRGSKHALSKSHLYIADALGGVLGCVKIPKIPCHIPHLFVFISS